MSDEKVGKPLLLVFPFGYLSHYLRCLMLARHLMAHFTVRFAAHPDYDPYVTAEGYDTFACAGMDAADTLACVQKFDFSWLNEPALDASLTAQVAAIEALQPVAVLGDASPTLKMAAQKTGVSYVSVVNGYMSKYFAGYRALSVSHPAYPMVRSLPVKLAALLTARGEAWGFRAVHKPFKRLRQKWGLPLAQHYLDEMEGDYTLISDLLSLFPQRKLPQQYRVVGPLFYKEKITGTGIIPEPAKVKQTIFVSMGSTGTWERVRFLNAAAFSEYQIIAAGDKERILTGDHIAHVPFADAAQLFPRVGLVVCHGGNGSIYQALSFGIPMVCVPGYFEQEWNAAAVAQQSLGANILPGSDDAGMPGIIKEWMSRKGSTPFENCQRRISAYEAALPGKIAALAGELLNKPTVIKAP
jgi:UDP:flavonoid glycosyltransferase YjiC (YdhE family)